MNAAVHGVSIEAADDTVKVRGDLTLATAANAVERGRDVFRQGEGELEFDLAALDHCDSAALAVLLEWRREAARRDRRLVWRSVPERLRQLARISELESVLQFD